jgi:ubiquinone/menaquinone biosynthesis C-methylase UbiE
MGTKMNDRQFVCPWWLCYSFDNPFRKWLHNPEAILGPYVRPGDTVIDIGAGMGYFTIPLAKLVGPAGHVTAIDVQGRMLAALTRRAERSGVSKIITPYLTGPDTLGPHSPVQFILAFWMVHEVPDQQRFLAQIAHLLNSDGHLLIVEPLMHVPQKNFLYTLQAAQHAGFEIREIPKIRLSRSALLRRTADRG